MDGDYPGGNVNWPGKDENSLNLIPMVELVDRPPPARNAAAAPAPIQHSAAPTPAPHQVPVPVLAHGQRIVNQVNETNLGMPIESSAPAPAPAAVGGSSSPPISGNPLTVHGSLTPAIPSTSGNRSNKRPLFNFSFPQMKFQKKSASVEAQNQGTIPATPMSEAIVDDNYVLVTTGGTSNAHTEPPELTGSENRTNSENEQSSSQVEIIMESVPEHRMCQVETLILVSSGITATSASENQNQIPMENETITANLDAAEDTFHFPNHPQGKSEKVDKPFSSAPARFENIQSQDILIRRFSEISIALGN